MVTSAIAAPRRRPRHSQIPARTSRAETPARLHPSAANCAGAAQHPNPPAGVPRWRHDPDPVSLHASATDALRAWVPDSKSQRRLRDAFLRHLDEHPDGVWRNCAPAPITASAAILDPAGRRLLLVLHRKVGRWLQPGGHCEAADPTLAAAALREATEESGIIGLELVPGILQVDRHPAPCNPGVVEEHLYVRYLVIARPDALPAVSHESADARWFPWDALPDDLKPTIHEMLALGRSRLGV